MTLSVFDPHDLMDRVNFSDPDSSRSEAEADDMQGLLALLSGRPTQAELGTVVVHSGHAGVGRSLPRQAV